MTSRRRALLINVAHGIDEVGFDHPRHHVAPMDLGIAAATLERDGWNVELWDTQTQPHIDPERIARMAHAKAPELLILRPNHRTIQTSAALAARLRDTTSLRCALGPAVQPHLTRLLSEPHEGADCPPLSAGFVGEPEGTLNEILPALREGTFPEGVAGLSTTHHPHPVSRPFIRDLDALEHPAHRLFMGQGYQFRYPLDVDGPLRIGYSMTSRGCALGCVFCAPIERESYGRQYRWRSAESVCDELAELVRLGANAVYFVDDFFAFSNRRLEELCETLLRRGVVLPWAAQVRAQGLSLDTLRLMRRAGCSTLCFGAESGSDRVLKMLRKGVTTDQILKQSELIRQAGIQQVGYFIVGVPGETDQERGETYRLIQRLQPDVAQIHIFNVFEGAPAYTDPRFTPHFDPEATKFSGPRGPMGETYTRLRQERRRFYRRYYFAPRYLGRQLRRRWRPMLSNLSNEFDFARRSARYFLRPGGGP